MKKYLNDGTYENLLKHLEIVQKHGLFKGKYDELNLESAPEEYYYHSECHKQVIRVKESDIKKRNGTTHVEKMPASKDGEGNDIEMDLDTPPFPDDGRGSDGSEQEVSDDYDDSNDEDWIPEDEIDAR